MIKKQSPFVKFVLFSHSSINIVSKLSK